LVDEIWIGTASENHRNPKSKSKKEELLDVNALKTPPAVTLR
jgi:hypothetical protein